MDTNLYRIDREWLVNDDTGEKIYSPLPHPYKSKVGPALGILFILLYGVAIGFLLGWWLT